MQTKCRKCGKPTEHIVVSEGVTKRGLKYAVVKCSVCGSGGSRILGKA